MKRSPTVVFGEWAEIGRDEGMEKGHQQSVDKMLSMVLKGAKAVLVYRCRLWKWLGCETSCKTPRMCVFNGC